MKKILSFLLSMLMVVSLSACKKETDTASAEASIKNLEENTTNEAENTRVVTDILGREVIIPKEINSIVCTGAGALRMVCYAQGHELVIGAEDIDKKANIKRAYNYAYNDCFKDLPSIGKGGGCGYTAYDEEIITLQPDMIFSSYTSDALEELSNKTGIPIVAVTYKTNLFDPNFIKSLELIGDILGKEERCKEVVSYIEDAKTDLNNRTKDIPDSEKPTAYTGAVTFSGGHGFAGTYGNFGPFNAINALNVSDETGEKSAFEVDLEKILVWDPDYIFLDPGNMSLVNEEYTKNPEYFNSLRAVKEGNVYSMISYNNYTTNIEVAIANAYYAGTILFPEQFSDINISEKADELLNKFLGKKFYSEMKDAGLSYKNIKIGE